MTKGISDIIWTDEIKSILSNTSFNFVRPLVPLSDGVLQHNREMYRTSPDKATRDKARAKRKRKSR